MLDHEGSMSFHRPIWNIRSHWISDAFHCLLMKRDLFKNKSMKWNQNFGEQLITLWYSPTWWLSVKNRLATQPDANGSFQSVCVSLVAWQWVTVECLQRTGRRQLMRAAFDMAVFANYSPAEGVAFIRQDCGMSDLVYKWTELQSLAV